MRYFKLLAATLLCSSTLTSCFKEEPLNTECDIEQAYIHSDAPEAMFFNLTDTLVKVLYDEDNINFMVKRGVDRSNLAPFFRTTIGATISPASGSVQDFSKGAVNYTVTSQDGQWHRNYQVFVNYPPVEYEEIKYDFEHYNLNTNKPKNKYYVWNELNSDGTLAYSWATGNPGYQKSKGTAQPNEFPTTPIQDGYEGAAVKLTTLDTGSWGEDAQMPIAAGNLFLGKFDVNVAIGEPMKGTMFGRPVSFKPISFKGYYKYKRGDKFIDGSSGKKVLVNDKLDYGTIYAVLYDNHNASGDDIVLYGDNVQTSDQIVALAILPNIDNTAEWTPFDIKFVYKKKIDADKIRNFGYSLAIVCSSSVDGAKFMGALGSTLCIDKLSIIREKEEDIE